ncbi:hypothetical protein [Dysgonomonas sp. 511]|uniref:phage head spike fiber domain-containing protein n=1 Tax=Dysgonomonas sp. 511 TaxID=2302930 RepID=UPI0013D7EBAE|nr:hypothetical protein [Dysgonomonas sp. 511]NDV77837.1 hypothetical protein [Dysgonomonas sp. 511]
MITIKTTEGQINISNNGVVYMGVAKNRIIYDPTEKGVCFYIAGKPEWSLSGKWTDGITLDGEEITPENIYEKFEALFFLDNGIKPSASVDDFPEEGKPGVIYIDESTNTMYRWDMQTGGYRAIPDFGGEIAISNPQTNDIPIFENNKWINKNFLQMMEDFGFEVTALNHFIVNLSPLSVQYDLPTLRNAFATLPPLVLESAKTVLIPGAYNIGVIYGMNPRTGDVVSFPFSRASGASVFNKAKNIVMTEANMPRLDYGYYSSKPKILIEKESTNLYLSSSGIDQDANPLKSSIVAFGDGFDVFPRTAAMPYPDESMSYAIWWGRFDGYTEDGVTYHYSVFVKDYNDNIGGEFDLRSTLTAGIRWERSKYNINDADFGEMTAVRMPYSRVSFRAPSTYTAAGSGGYVGLQKRKEYDTKDFVFTGFQVEKGDVTSYIPAPTNTQVTRTADLLTYDMENACSHGIFTKTSTMKAFCNSQYSTAF